MRAKKSLGQHFLTSKGIAASIVRAAKIEPHEAVLEIGPGRGILTEALLAHAGHVVAVEKDPELVTFLKIRFAKEIREQKLTLVQSDVLRFNPSNYSLLAPTFRSGQATYYKLVANIPYYITGAILEHFLTNKHQPDSMTLLVQKEVAERIIAKNGKESVLSISVKAYGTPRYVRTVKASLFNPPPKVDSALLLIANISRDFFVTNGIAETTFFNLVKKGFAHKRKRLAYNFKHAGYDKHLIESMFTFATLSNTVRAEDVPLSAWRALAERGEESIY
ncbi:16S rRNA (adenine(1518)-N(6)/adenine(1519)-N(6))-dimethyltransferase RsmA [Candidatus Wolfebacteria bacterium]|nr:16S rRNA (adenine(1518)-N(6)/adenine(1519)-N(6))-dimethyltransferase RsmA [Candidatus Wolfebacteria bacterium]